jgi:DNA replication protein DnaC
MGEMVNIGGGHNPALNALLERMKRSGRAAEALAAQKAELEAPPANILDRLEEGREVIPSQLRRVVVGRPLKRCNLGCTPCQGGRHGQSFDDDLGRRTFRLCPCGIKNKQLEAIERMRLPAGAQRLTLERYEMSGRLAQVVQEWRRLVAEGEAPALILTGGVGTGKTHLLVGLALDCTLQGKRAAYIEAHHYRALRGAQMDKVNGFEQIEPEEAIKGARALLIDEVGMQRGDYERREINRLLHEAHASRLPIAIASNLTPAELGLTGEEGYLTAPVADRLRGASRDGQLHVAFTGKSRR